MATNYFGNTFGKGSSSYAGGKNVWHEVKAMYPVGGVVDLTDYSAGDIIPAGSVVVLDQAAHTAVIAPAYSSTKTSYAVGDYVMQSGALYICKTAIAAAEDFTAAKWTIQTAATITAAGKSVGLLYNDILIDAAAKGTYGKATASCVYAGEVYVDRLAVPLANGLLALVPQIVPIFEA